MAQLGRYRMTLVVSVLFRHESEARAQLTHRRTDGQRARGEPRPAHANKGASSKCNHLFFFFFFLLHFAFQTLPGTAVAFFRLVTQTAWALPPLDLWPVICLNKSPSLSSQVLDVGGRQARESSSTLSLRHASRCPEVGPH